MPNTVAMGCMFAISAGIAVGVMLAVRGSLMSLLERVVGLPAVTEFYSRLFFLCLLLLILSETVGYSTSLKAGAAFMEYVWEVAHRLSNLFSQIYYLLLAYLLLMTILVAVLRKRDGE